MIQNTGPDPNAALAAPKISGMPTLETLMVIRRKPKAWPCRSCGVTWCKALMTMGCTEPRNRPNTVDKIPIIQASVAQG